MKLHFGHKIAIVYVAFMIFMLSMLYFSMQMDHELVTDEYYTKELAFQGKKDAWHNMQAASFSVDIRTADKVVYIEFSGLSDIYAVVGEVTLYKPDNADLDELHELKLDASESMAIAPRGEHGRYKVGVRFSMDGEDYYTEKEIVL